MTMSSVTLTSVSKYPMYEDRQYYMIAFTEIDAEGKEVGYMQFWNYDPLSNDYPVLDIPEDIAYTQYMPIVPLRINNKNLTDPTLAGTPLYDTSKELLNKIGLKMDQLNEGINENPDINEVDHAYVVLGVSLHTEKDESNDYLYRFFDDLYARSFFSVDIFSAWLNSGKTNTPPTNSIKISDGTYNTQIVYYYVDKTTGSGKVAEVGKVAKVITPWKKREVISNGSLSYGYENPDNKVILRKQITEDTYDEVVISGLLFINNIYGARDYVTTIDKSDTDSFIIPINLSISEQMSILDNNTVYYDALKIVFNAYEYTKLKWYETGFFKFVVAIVSIAITISMGYDFGISSLIAAASTGALAFTSFILQQAFTYVAVSFGFKLAADKLGIEFAAILAVIAIAYGSLGSESLFNLPMADSLMFMGTLGMKSSLEFGYEELKGEYDAILSEAERLQKEIDTANELLDTGTNLIDPLNTFTDLNMLPMEPMDSFIGRSLMINQGVSSIDMVSSFVDTQLLLPTAENYYG